jgi:hypothetical protein
MASVAAISGVYLLEKVIEADDRHNIAWAAGAFALFVIASVVLGLMGSASPTAAHDPHEKACEHASPASHTGAGPQDGDDCRVTEARDAGRMRRCQGINGE